MWPGRIGILQVKVNGVGEAAIYTNSMAYQAKKHSGGMMVTFRDRVWGSANLELG